MHKMDITSGTLFLAVVFVAACVPTRLQAQTPTAQIRGAISDSLSRPLLDVEVVAVSLENGYRYRTFSTRGGWYWLRALQPGRYDVTAQRVGLQPVTVQNVVLVVGRTASVDFELHEGIIQLPPVTVTAPPDDVTSSAISYTLDRERIDRIPEESRRFLDLVRLVPGATTESDKIAGTAPFGTDGAAVGALDRQSLGVLVDGGDFTEGLFGNPAGSIPLLAVREIEVLQSQYSAEMGRAASGVVNVVTRRGSNEFSVEGFGLFRHHSLTAKGAFENEKPDFNRRHWGVAAGGPVTSGQSHFFVAFERRVQNDFATVNTDGAFPAYEGTFRTPLYDNLMFARLDHYTSSHGLTVRYAGEIGEQLVGVGGVRAFEHGHISTVDLHSGLLTHRWTLPGSWLNEVRLHVISVRRSLHRNAEDGPTLIYPQLRAGPHQSQVLDRSLRVELRDDASWIAQSWFGTHLMKVGAHVSWLHTETRSSFFENGFFVFEASTDSLPIFGRVSFDDPAIRLDARNLQLAFYAQDDWTPVSRLTINLGVRYDIETNGSNQGFVSPFAGQLPFIPTEPRPIDKNNISPRVGFAWDVTGRGRAVIRGGFGIFYDALAAAPLVALERSTGVRLAEIPAPGTTEVDELAIDPATLPPIVWTSDNIRTPMTRQYSLGVHGALPGDVRFRVDGLFVEGRNLVISRSLNPLIDGTRPFPGFSQITQKRTEGRADAKLLLVEVRKAFADGWLDVGYTLADRKDTHDTWGGLHVPETDPDRLDLTEEWGPSSRDERHRLVTIAGIRLPHEFGAVARITYVSARPYTAVTGRDDNGDGDFSNDRPPGESRNAHRGPDYFRADLGFTWGLAWQRTRLGVSVNIYNLFDTTNEVPSSVQTNVQSPVFGRALAAFPGRQVEVGLRVRY